MLNDEQAAQAAIDRREHRTIPIEEMRRQLDDLEGLVAPSPNPKDAIGVTKPQVHLVPPAALIYAAKVMELGASKYGAYNWRSAKVNRTVYLSAAMRHLLRALDGEDTDPESDMPPEAHVLSCMAIVLDALATGNLIDDRPKPGAAATLIEEMSG